MALYFTKVLRLTLAAAVVLAGAGAALALPDKAATAVPQAAGDPGLPVSLQSRTTGSADWSPPQQISPDQDAPPGADAMPGSDPAGAPENNAPPTVEWRASADASATGGGAEAGLAPRVDLAGPGTPKWKVIIYVTQKNTIDDNIYISHSGKKADAYFTIAPGLALGWGDFRGALLAHTSRLADQYGFTRAHLDNAYEGSFAYFNYTASATHFLKNDSQDAIDQDASAFAQWDLSKVVLGLNARVQTLSGPDIDVGSRTRRTLFTIKGDATYSLSDKSSFGLSVGGVVRDYSTQLSSSEWDGQLTFDYQVAPKTRVGLEVVGGIRTVESTPDQYYQQFQVRMNYQPTAKLTLRLNGGIEIDEAQGSTATPVFGLGVSYILDDDDALSLDAYRATSNSPVVGGETVENTGINVEIRHRLLSTCSLGCSLGYRHADYYAEGLSALTRKDDYLFVRASLAYDFAQWSQIEIAYEFHRNISNDQPFDFAENLATLQLNLVF